MGRILEKGHAKEKAPTDETLASRESSPSPVRLNPDHWRPRLDRGTDFLEK